MKHFFYVLFFLFLLSKSVQAQRATGLLFDDKKYNSSKRISPALKFSGANIPKSYSLKQYCPDPGDQGQVGSCVGWSLGYGALSIAEAIRNNTTDKAAITASARSAMYIYEQLMTSCLPGGIVIDDAMHLVKDKGDCLSKEFDFMPCSTPVPDNLHPLAAQFKILDFSTLFDYGLPDEKIINTIQSILAGKPVVIGMEVGRSIQRVGPSGLYAPPANEVITGGHALCVIGYDDNTQMFEILNSWGSNWGDRGFFRMSYNDYGKYAKYGYQFMLEQKNKNEEVKLAGSFKFKKYKFGTFEDAPVTLNNNEYTIANVRLNDFFRIAATGTKDRYIYLFSIKPDGSAEILFPTQRKVDAATIKDLPVIPSDDVVLEIPADPNKGITTDIAGNDALIILYSAEALDDIDDIVKRVKNGSGDFSSRLQSALGSRLMPAADITYSSTDMSLTAASSKGYVAPLVLKVNVHQ